MWRAVLVLCWWASSQLPKPQTHVHTRRKRERGKPRSFKQAAATNIQTDLRRFLYILLFWILYAEDKLTLKWACRNWYVKAFLSHQTSTGDILSASDLWTSPWDWLTADLPSVAKSSPVLTGVRQQVNKSNAWQSRWSTTETTPGKRAATLTRSLILTEKAKDDQVCRTFSLLHLSFFFIWDWYHNFKVAAGFKD